MRSKGLQIGNILKDKLTGARLVVIGLSENEVQTRVIDPDKFSLPEGWEAESIPLTPEILVQTVFAKDGTDPVSELDKYEYEGIILLADEAGFLFIHGEAVTIIYSVDELQNLFFALMGRELKFQ
ncbi:MAG: hypothetical protein ABI760_21735 [Ferruginibacter sp.]